ncbi:MAG: exopolysaccharide biosynthesis protein [Oceanicaulis sp.]
MTDPARKPEFDAEAGPEGDSDGRSGAARAAPDAGGGLIEALEEIAATAPDEGLTLGAFTHALGERVFGVLLFALAIPVCMPFLYGVPQVVALPMMALALQMAAGREEPWLPGKFAGRVMSKADLSKMARGARKWFGWVEALARPRLRALSGPTAERLVGAVFVLFCASILVPLPATNTTPGVAVALASIGLITRDGVLVLLGLVLGVAWIALLIIGFSLFGLAFIDLVKDFVTGLFSTAGGAG